ncbi:CLUMA_CG005334, isoform A, partial [Clunio marinus]
FEDLQIQNHHHHPSISERDCSGDEMETTLTNLTSISWSHRTNSQSLLDEVLKSDINMIEADIVYGVLNNDSSEEMQPIMGHPPETTSDISLRSFLNQVLDYNKNKDISEKKGVKLDFKSTTVYKSSLPLLMELWDTMDYPVWINADIYPGPWNNTSTIPVDAQEFFDGAKKLKNAVLSPGWTTAWGYNYTDGHYTQEQVDAMINVIKENNITNQITFPVRAGIASQSVTELDHLYRSLNMTNAITFTLWSSVNDSVNVEKLRDMIFHFGVDKVYIDIPEELFNQLNLDNERNSSRLLKPLMLLSLIYLFVLIF